MPESLVQVKEYECMKCGYKWINRKNGKEEPRPLRCAKCKSAYWDKDWISKKESRYRYKLRFTVGEYKSHPLRPHYWKTDAKVDELLKYRPSIKDMRVILQPMCYLFKEYDNTNASKALYDDRYTHWTMSKLGFYSEKELSRFKRDMENSSIKDINKIREYQLQLSRQLVEYFLEKYSAPYQRTVVSLKTNKK